MDSDKKSGMLERLFNTKKGCTKGENSVELKQEDKRRTKNKKKKSRNH